MASENNHKTTVTSTLECTVRLLAPLAYAAAIVCLSLTSSPPRLPGILGWDKLLHAGAYAVLAALIAQALICLPVKPSKVLVSALLISVSFGAFLEVMQYLLHAGRTAEWWDLFADAVGACLSCVIFHYVSGLTFLRNDVLDKK